MSGAAAWAAPLLSALSGPVSTQTESGTTASAVSEVTELDAAGPAARINDR